jgi:hypothetical protein
VLSSDCSDLGHHSHQKWVGGLPKVGGRSFNPNYARTPLQKFEVFAELLLIVQWSELLESLFHEEAIKGGSVSTLKTIRKQPTKKLIGGL